MSIVSAKCPNCGASIQLDNERKEGFCSYCGSKVEVQAAISLVRIDNANELENYLNLAEAAIDGRNGDEAYKYANKVLEIDSRNGKAWLMKMLALDYLGTLQDNKVSDIIIAGNNAIKFSADPDTEVRVYSFYLSKAATILQICISHISDTTNVKEMWDLNLQVNFSSASERTASFDSSFVQLMEANAITAQQLKKEVPIDKISNNPLYISYVEDIARDFVTYTEALGRRYIIYGYQLQDSAIEARRSALNELKEGLPDDKSQSISADGINNNHKAGACYIATAVYDSYDAPEVLVLRKFRDNILAKSLVGRTFIKTYYRLSPPVAEKLKSATRINHLVRKALDRFIHRIKNLE